MLLAPQPDLKSGALLDTYQDFVTPVVRCSTEFHFHAFMFVCISLPPVPTPYPSSFLPGPFFRDTLNTPFFGEEGNFEEFTANAAGLGDHPYAPIAKPYDETGSAGTTYKWPLQGSKGYYSLMYSGALHTAVFVFNTHCVGAKTVSSAGLVLWAYPEHRKPPYMCPLLSGRPRGV